MYVCIPAVYLYEFTGNSGCKHVGYVEFFNSWAPWRSKVIEKAVGFHLNKYLTNNNLNESIHSAYKSGHSTVTALVRVKNDIMMSIDQGKPVILVLLNLTAAFDTADHT